MPISRETFPRSPSLVDRIIGAATQPARDRTSRFMAKMDAHLATLPNDAARLAFCEQQAAHWIRLYEVWALAVDSGRLEVKPGAATAWDYNFTIAAIAAKKAQFQPDRVSA